MARIHWRMYTTILNVVIVAGTGTLMILAVLDIISFDSIQALVTESEHIWLSGFALAGIMFIATVIAPVTTVFLVPTAAGVIGLVPAALFSAGGWVAGTIVAFFLARRFGRPLVTRFVNEDKLALFERYIPSANTFWTLVFLCIVTPPDILGYALGLLSRVSLKRYAIAAIIGDLPFAFFWAYVGTSFVSGDYVSFALILIVGLLFFALVWKGVHGMIARQQTLSDKA